MKDNTPKILVFFCRAVQILLIVYCLQQEGLAFPLGGGGGILALVYSHTFFFLLKAICPINLGWVSVPEPAVKYN